MVLIIGGAYQGKLEFARGAFSLREGDVFTCNGVEIDFSKPCIYALEEFVYACLEQGIEPVAHFAAQKALWQDSVLICQDMSSGVVPIDAMQRQWRHSVGGLCQYLAGQAEQVSRIFCGLEQRLK